MRRGHAARLMTIAASTLLAGCGASAVTGGSASPTPTPSPSTRPACGPASPTAQAPVGTTQALRVIPVLILADVPVSAAVEQLGAITCVTVGVGQRVSMEVDARIPPPPAEVHGDAQLLSPITVSPAVPAGATQPQAGHYRLTFTALAAGSTALTYLPGRCTLPPGVC